MPMPDTANSCVAEVFETNHVIDRERGMPWLVGFATSRPYPSRSYRHLADPRRRVDRDRSGQRARARRWSVAIHQALPAIDGLLHPSSTPEASSVVQKGTSQVVLLPGWPVRPARRSVPGEHGVSWHERCRPLPFAAAAGRARQRGH
jgi:hypothetical protein